jgi:DMSO reductase anchor subunit
LANVAAGDEAALRPQHAHWPLVIMLVLTQMSVGMFAFNLTAPSAIRSTVALIIGLLALGASTCHLGRPLYAFRAFIGLRHSWLSREIVVFGGFAAAAITYTALQWFPVAPTWVTAVAGQATVVNGVLGIFCSVMIYVFTRREFWSLTQTSTKFFLSMMILGTAGSWASLTFAGSTSSTLPTALLVASLIKLGFEASTFRHFRMGLKTQLGRSLLLMSNQLRMVTGVRFILGIIGGVVLPTITLFGVSNSAVPIVSMITCLIAEIAERYLFFAAVSPDKMPGGLQV